MNNQQTNVRERTTVRSGESDGVVDKAKEKASDLAADAKDRGEELVAEGRDKAEELGERAGEMARSRAAQEKERIATGVRTFADVLRRGSDDLSPDRSQYRSIMTSAADRVEEVSDYLERHDVDDLTRDVRRFAREHTPLFLGGAFILGFAGARFLKSSGAAARERDAGGHDRDNAYRYDRVPRESDRYDDRSGNRSRFDAGGERGGMHG